MQNEYTLQIRVNFPNEPDKCQAMEEAVKRAGATLLAMARLLKDGPDPALKMWCDHQVWGTKDIELFGDTLAEGQRMIKEAGASMADQVEVSDDLKAALREMGEGS